MAYFAELDHNACVIRVISVSNEITHDEAGIEHEDRGIEFCKSLFGGRWKQTSFTGKIRKNFAAPGYIYDIMHDAFIAPRPEGLGWTFNNITFCWYNPEMEAAQTAITMEITRV